MKFAVGCDIESVTRFKDNIGNSIFIDKIFTTNEKKYSFSKKNPAQHLAARFCAKEATLKALMSLNIKHMALKDIEVDNHPSGEPHIRLRQNTETPLHIKLSMSHSEDNATAYVLIVECFNVAPPF